MLRKLSSARCATRSGLAPCRLPGRPTRPLGVSTISSATSQGQAGDSYELILLARRELQLAVSEEDYARAAQLRDAVADLSARLPTSKQLLLRLVDALQAPGSSLEARRAAAQQLGQLGDEGAVPHLAAALGDPRLAEWAEASMWELFARCPTPETQALMDSGCRMMQHPQQWAPALQAFTDMIRQAPSYAEGYNKRATVLFLMGRYRDAVEDCIMALDLNPYHFGAASGMGMCQANQGHIPEAIKAFEQALVIHPQLTHLRQHIETLRDMLREQRGRESGGGSEL